MRKRILVLLVLAQLITLTLLSQTKSAYQVDLKTGSFVPRDRIDEKTISEINDSLRKGRLATIIQFHVPADVSRNIL